MSQNLNTFNAAYQAFSEWYLMEAKERIEVLGKTRKLIPSNLVSAFDYQYQHASNITDKTESLTSPTGETNELYTQGRGVAILLVQSKDEHTHQATIATLVALLIAGNSVIVCSDDTVLTDLVSTIAQSLTTPKMLLQVESYGSYSSLLQQDIRNFAFIGEKQTSIELNKELAAKPNAITALVAETDLAELPNAKDPSLTLRFVTERVRTTNITAIGGNAMLLELGSDNH